MKYLAPVLLAAVLGLTACGEANAPSPNDTRAVGDTGQPEPLGDPAAGSGEGGRGSAATGATDQGLENLPAGDATTEQQPEIAP